MYPAIKHLHIGFVILSGTGFFLRGLLMLHDSPLLRQRWIKVVRTSTTPCCWRPPSP
jgi:uncharacterized membrane protein SirB2